MTETELLDLVIKAATLALSISAIVVAYVRTRSAGVDRRFEDGSKRMDAHDVRITRLETQIAAMPGHADLHGLEMQLARMTGEMSTMAEMVRGQSAILGRVETVVSRHEDHLLEAGKR